MPIEVAHARLELAGLLAERRRSPWPRPAPPSGLRTAALHTARSRCRDYSARRSPSPWQRHRWQLTSARRRCSTCSALGLSNPEIADRLFISRKTVEHHVGNVLAKLGLRSRAEAAAYVTRSETRVRNRGPPGCARAGGSSADRTCNREDDHGHRVRRDRRRRALRRLADCDAAGAQGLPGAAGRSSDVSERHAVDAPDPRPGRRRA